MYLLLVNKHTELQSKRVPSLTELQSTNATYTEHKCSILRIFVQMQHIHSRKPA